MLGPNKQLIRKLHKAVSCNYKVNIKEVCSFTGTPQILIPSH